LTDPVLKKIVALGGGVVGDCRVRRFDFMHVAFRTFRSLPPSCPVDSAVGGKTAIICRREKTWFGSFHQPSLVLADTGRWNITEQVIERGLRRSHQYGVIEQPDLLDTLANPVFPISIH